MATVSVMILTYNHAPYLAQALESVLSQETTHDIEIVIIEDCSTDGTQDIVREYARKYPEKIKAHLHEKNVGRVKGIQTVVYEGFTKLMGDYIAVLEGDDYWSRTDKIHEQVSFLEENPDFAAAAHNTVKIYEDSSNEPHRFLYWEGTKAVHDIHNFAAMESFFHISSMLFRNMRKLTGDKSFAHIKNDWCCEIYFNMVHTQFGKLHYVDEDMSVYRCHKGGNFSNMSQLQARLFNIEGHWRFNFWLRLRYIKDFSFAVYRLCRELIKLSEKGELPALTKAQYYRYKLLGGLHGKIYDWIDAYPKLDPAVFWYGEPPKVSETRLSKICGYDGAPPKVSIMLITYNHEKFIAQTIESILMQETEYTYEINVIEDCSTDGTRDVVMRYVEQYPDKVKPFFNKENIGHKVTQKNAFKGLKTLKGEYIAIIEGDDYWSSPHKLQKQIAFLEANPDYVACAHNVIKMYEDGSREPHRFLYWPGKPETQTIEDAISMQSYFHITTLMFRNVYKGNPTRHFKSKWSCEIFVAIAHAQFGKIRYFDEDMSVYRAHAGGRFSNMKILESWFFNIGSLRRYNQWLGYRHMKAFSGSIVRYCYTVLGDAGKVEGTVPLTLYQTIKYNGIRLCYSILFGLMDAKDEMLAALRAKRRGAHVLALAPLHFLLFTARCAAALMLPLADASWQCCIFVTPAPVRRAVRDTWLLVFENEDIGHLQWLWKQNELFTPKGAFHGRNALRTYIMRPRRIMGACYERFAPTPLKFIARGAKGLSQWAPRSFLFLPMRYCVSSIRRLRACLRHEEINHLYWLTKERKLFTAKGAYHARKIVRLFANVVKRKVFGSISGSARGALCGANSLHGINKPEETLRHPSDPSVTVIPASRIKDGGPEGWNGLPERPSFALDG